MIEVVTTVFQCECGRNIIILDENLDDDQTINEDTEILYPICGQEMVSEMTRVIKIETLKR